MSVSIAEFAAWIAVQVPVQDTILMRQIPGEPSLLDQVTSVASTVLTISFLVLTVALVPAAWSFRKSYKRINELLDRVYGDINPLMRHASSIADDVNYISTSIRVDMQQINQTIAVANTRLTEAIAMTEDRIREVNALLMVVQEEVEDMFVSTASAVHGVRVGASVLRDEVLPRPLEVEVQVEAGAETLDEEYDTYDDLQDTEVTDGNYDTSTDDSDTEPDEPAGPRIRRRPRPDRFAR